MIGWLLDRLPDAALTRSEALVLLAVLRPAESAARRLVAWMALFMQMLPRPPAEAKARKRGKRGRKGGGGSLPLFDRRNDPTASKREKGKRPNPNIRDPLVDGPLGDRAPPPGPDDEIDAARLRQRIDALKRALGDLPGLAARMARLYAEGRAKWVHPIRTGRPPGRCRRSRHPVQQILEDCNLLYWMAVRDLEKPPP